MSKTVVKVDSNELDFETKSEILAALLGRKKEMDEKIKPLKQQIIDHIQLHKAELFKDSKSFKVGGLEVSLSQDHVYELGDEFDLSKFFLKFPKAVKYSLSHTNMKNIDMEKYDIKLQTGEKIEVGLIKEKKSV